MTSIFHLIGGVDPISSEPLLIAGLPGEEYQLFHFRLAVSMVLNQRVSCSAAL